MKGCNTFRLNQTTMVEAVQDWLNKQVTPFSAPKVINVVPIEKRGVDLFEVTILSDTVEEKEE